MIIPGTPYLIGGAAVLSLVAGTYAGSQIEHGRHVAREAATAARIEKARAKLQAAFDAIASRTVAEAQVQTRTFTEIRNVAGPIIYRNVNVCLRSDDAGLLDRARDAANGIPAGASSGGAAVAPVVPPEP